jgi:hypothetical protein
VRPLGPAHKAQPDLLAPSAGLVQIGSQWGVPDQQDSQKGLPTAVRGVSPPWLPGGVGSVVEDVPVRAVWMEVLDQLLVVDL